MPIATLKKRSEFLRIRGGQRWSTPAFIIERKVRPGDVKKNCAEVCLKSCHCSTAGNNPRQKSEARFGFTVSKKMGKAIVRNRMRRRLRALVEELAPELADRASDYVIVARKPALDRGFADMKNDMRIAFNRLHSSQPGVSQEPRRLKQSAAKTANGTGNR